MKWPNKGHVAQRLIFLALSWRYRAVRFIFLSSKQSRSVQNPRSDVTQRPVRRQAAHNFSLDSPTRYHDITLHTLTLSVNDKVAGCVFLSRSIVLHWVNLPAAHRPGVFRKFGASLSSVGRKLLAHLRAFAEKGVSRFTIYRAAGATPTSFWWIRRALVTFGAMQIRWQEENGWSPRARSPRVRESPKLALSLHFGAYPQNDIQNTHRNLAHVCGFCGSIN